MKPIDIRLKRMQMKQQELRQELEHFKFKLYQHLEERSTTNANTGYVSFLEWNIDNIKQQMRTNRVAA